jgi:diguanylate cyclase (GGDEF)-like protein/PAS domain S-box-containing protein
VYSVRALRLGYRFHLYLGVIALGVAAYVLVFLALFPRMGLGVAALSAVWVGLAGWLLGMGGGLALAVLNFPLHVWLFSQVGEPVLMTLKGPGFYVGLLLGAASGWVRGLLDRARASEERYRLLVEMAPIGVLVHDGERILYANPEAGRIFGAERPEALRGHPVLNLVVPESLALVQQRLEGLRRGQPWVGLAEVTLRRLDGSPVMAEVAGARVWYGEGQAVQVTLRDLSAQRQLLHTVEHLTYHDPVTELPNRAALVEAGAKVLALAQRQGWRVAALWLDLGDFASLREVLGQHRADRLLRRVGERLRRTTREQDYLASCGRDEFALLVQNATPTGVLRLARRLQRALEEPFILEGWPVHLSPSVGIACYPKNAPDLEGLLSAAYAAVQRARGEDCRIALFDPEGAQRARESMALEEELRQALEEGELVLHYQPVFDLRGPRPRLAGVEALARWFHPTRGSVSPEVFIPLAEERGLIRELDRYVLRRALGEAAALPGWVAVNLSAQSFRDSGLIRFLQEGLERSGLDPRRLVLEITERTLAEPQAAQPVLQRLKALGVQVAVDDFGTGYSSLSYLRSFPLDHLKIDRSFVRGIGRHPEDEAVLRGILSLAESLGLECVAEGVETAEQAGWLRAEGCTLAQGYHFARPMPPEQLRAYVQNFVRTG